MCTRTPEHPRRPPRTKPGFSGRPADQLLSYLGLIQALRQHVLTFYSPSLREALATEIYYDVKR